MKTSKISHGYYKLFKHTSSKALQHCQPLIETDMQFVTQEIEQCCNQPADVSSKSSFVFWVFFKPWEFLFQRNNSFGKHIYLSDYSAQNFYRGKKTHKMAKSAIQRLNLAYIPGMNEETVCFHMIMNLTYQWFNMVEI